jgi:hypothetical protein
LKRRFNALKGRPWQPQKNSGARDVFFCDDFLIP